LSIKWAQDHKLPLMRALDVLTAQPAKLLGEVATKSGLGHLTVGASADVVVFDPEAHWQVLPEKLHSQGKHTPFAFDMSGFALPAQVKATWVSGRLTYQA